MAELGAFLLPAVPLLGLLVMLLFGHYPGCEAIVRFAERIAARQGTAGNPPLAPTQPQPPRSFAPGGGLLIALCLAQRPPPLAA